MAPADPLMAPSPSPASRYARTGMATAAARISGQRYRGRSAGASMPVAAMVRNPATEHPIRKKNGDSPLLSPAGSGRTSSTARWAPCFAATAWNSVSTVFATATPDALLIITVAAGFPGAAGT